MRFSTLLPAAGIFFFIILAFNACSNVQETSAGTTSFQSDMSDNSFTFKDDGNKWRVDFEDGEISAIYKNGEKIPGEEHSKYETMIFDNLNNLKHDMSGFKSDMLAFEFDMNKFKDDMKEMKLNIIRDLPGKIEIDINKEELKESMNVLKESLKDLKTKKFEFHFDKEAFNEDMKKLKEDIKKIDFDKIQIEVRKNLEDAEEELAKVKINIENLDIDLSGLDEDLKTLNVEMEKLDNFLKEMKIELVKDGYLKSEDEKMNLTLNEDVIKINGKSLSPEHHSKYLDLYEKHFDKKIKGDFKIRIRK